MDTELSDTAARMRRSINRLSRKLRQSALGGITPAQASLLAVIDKYVNPSLGDLAVIEQVQPPSVTRLVKSMEFSGLISCVSDVEDRRCTRVRITALGKKELNAIRKRKTEFLERKLLSLSEHDQMKAKMVADFLENLLEDQ